MKGAKKLLAVVMAVAVFAGFSAMSLPVSAEQKDTVEGIRWFPANMERDNGFDDIWEVDCGPGVCQRFNEAETNPDAAEPHISTVYDENGALTMQRTGADGQGEVYWPRVRTLYLEESPVIDLTTANILYYDFEATGCKWMIDLIFNGLELKLGKAICEASGTATLSNTDEDGVAGTYQGSINLTEVIASIAADSADPHSTEMQALKNLKKTFVPQIELFIVGDTNGTIKWNSLYISSEDDPNGEKCDLMDMGLVYGDEYYEVDAPSAGDENTTVDAETTEDVTDATTAAATTTAAAATDASGFSAGMIAVIAIVVAVVVAVIVVVIVSAKKKGKGEAPPAPPAA